MRYLDRLVDEGYIERWAGARGLQILPKGLDILRARGVELSPIATRWDFVGVIALPVAESPSMIQTLHVQAWRHRITGDIRFTEGGS